MTATAPILFSEDYYNTVIGQFGYSTFEMKQFNFDFAGLSDRELNTRYLCHHHEQPPFEPGVINGLPEWNDKGGFPQINDPKYPVGRDPLNELENCDVFFSHPVDLDMMLLKAFPGKYEVTPETPSTSTIRAVLGKNHVNEYQLDDDVWKLFPCYDAKFGRKSKPATHLRAMSGLDDKELLGHLPAVLDRLVNRVKEKLKELPE